MRNRSSMATVKNTIGNFQLNSAELASGSKKACIAFILITIGCLVIYTASALPVYADIFCDETELYTQQSILTIAKAVILFIIVITVVTGFVLYLVTQNYATKRVTHKQTRTILRENKDIAPNSIRSLHIARVAYRAYLEVLIFAEAQVNTCPAKHNLFLKANNKGSTPALKIIVQYAVLDIAQSNVVRIFVDRQQLGTGTISGGGPHDYQFITGIIFDHNVKNKIIVRISYTDIYGTFVVEDYLAEFSSNRMRETGPNIHNARVYAKITTNPSISYEGTTISPRQAMREKRAL